MFNIKSKVLKNFRLCNDKYSICIYRHKELDLLPRITLEKIQGDSLTTKNLVFSWIFWEISFSQYTRIVNEKKTTEIPDDSLVNDFLHQQLEPIMAAKKEAEEKEKLEEKLPDGVDYTKIKLEMVRANDLFKDKWKEVSSALNSPSLVFGCPNNYINYTISAGDLADINLKIKEGCRSRSLNLNPLIIQEEHDYFNRHFKSMTINPSDLEDWGKLEKEWLESGNKITPIPKEEGRIITKEDIIHTIAFVQPLGLDSYIKSALCDQKEKGKYSLSGDIDTILTGAYKQVNIFKRDTIDTSEIMKGKFIDYYINKIPKFFKEHFSEKWEEVRKDLADKSKNYQYVVTKEESDSVARDIVSNIFPDNLEIFDEVYEPQRKGFIITSSMIEPGASFTNWKDEFTDLVKDLDLFHPKQWVIQIAHKLGMYAFVPSYGLKNWNENEGDLIGKVQEAINAINEAAEETIKSLNN